MYECPQAPTPSFFFLSPQPSPFWYSTGPVLYRIIYRDCTSSGCGASTSVNSAISDWTGLSFIRVAINFRLGRATKSRYPRSRQPKHPHVHAPSISFRVIPGLGRLAPARGSSDIASTLFLSVIAIAIAICLAAPRQFLSLGGPSFVRSAPSWRRIFLRLQSLHTPTKKPRVLRQLSGPLGQAKAKSHCVPYASESSPHLPSIQ
jgi:hypothetical protein